MANSNSAATVTSAGLQGVSPLRNGPPAPSKPLSYEAMIRRAVIALRERNGSSCEAIQRYIQDTYMACFDKLSRARLKIALKRGVELGWLTQSQGNKAARLYSVPNKAALSRKKKISTRTALVRVGKGRHRRALRNRRKVLFGERNRQRRSAKCFYR